MAIEASAEFRGVRASRAVEFVDLATDAGRLSQGGFWVVVADFAGPARAWRFAEVERRPEVKLPPAGERQWHGPDRDQWVSSLSRDHYIAGVERIRADIRDGEVYQVNLCRVLEAPLAAGQAGPDAVALSELLARGNPARYASRITIPADADNPGLWVVSASPELYLRIDDRRIRSAPIKGTAAPGESMLDKDLAENIMITDLIRNDLSHVARPGSVEVEELLGEHDLPGLVHLQSTVAVDLADEFAWTARLWPALMNGTFPPGSVSGAPKSSALRIIAREETAERGPYCGAIGWIDADVRQAELAVGIRTFWWDQANGGTLRFGTGAGITWGSDPAGEWEETELKTQRLIGLASSRTIAT